MSECFYLRLCGRSASRKKKLTGFARVCVCTCACLCVCAYMWFRLRHLYVSVLSLLLGMFFVRCFSCWLVDWND